MIDFSFKKLLTKNGNRYIIIKNGKKWRLEMNSVLFVTSFVGIVAVIVLIFILIEQAKKYKILEVSYDSLRAYRHDYANALQAIGGYIELGDLKGLKGFYADFTKELYKTSVSDVLSNKNINNPAIYRTLKNKFCLAKDNRIDMNVNSFADLSKLNIKSFVLNRALGILLDNSIEAAKEAPDRYINVMITEFEKGGVLIKIDNTFNTEQDIDINKIYTKDYTTKKKNSGIGLWEIKRIIEHNDNIKLNTKIDGKMFIQELQVK